jgi:hypothetical protein
VSQIFWECVGFASATLLRLLWTYANPPFGSIARQIIVGSYATLLSLHLLFMCMLIGLFSAWFVLAAVLHPQRYLPYGTSVVVCLVVVRTISAELTAAAEKLAHGIQAAVLRALRSRLEHARRQIELTTFERLAKEQAKHDDSFDSPLGPHLDRRHHTAAGAEGGHGGGGGKNEITAADIFALLREAHAAEHHDEEAEIRAAEEEHHSGTHLSDTISAADFQRLFRAFDLPFADTQLERLFAMTDLDGNGRVSSVEFEGAWDLLTKEVIEESVAQFGLSSTHRVFLVVSFVSMLLILLVFILLTLSGWFANEDSFSSVAQSALVGMVAKGITAVRSRSKAEQGGSELEKVIEELVGEQEAAAEDE